MEHILQFAVNIDDDTIKKRIEDAAVKDVVDSLKVSVKNTLLERWEGSLTEFGKNIVKEVMGDYREEIISQATKTVVNSIKNSKQYKEAISNLGDDLK